MLPKFVCPKCQHEYTLGVNGVITGCDQCEGTVRNLPGGYVLSTKETAEGCTCLEKACDDRRCPIHGEQ